MDIASMTVGDFLGYLFGGGGVAFLGWVVRNIPRALAAYTAKAEAEVEYLKSVSRAASRIPRFVAICESMGVALCKHLGQETSEIALHDSDEHKIVELIGAGRLDEAKEEIEKHPMDDSLHGRLGKLASEILSLQRQAKSGEKEPEADAPRKRKRWWSGPGAVSRH